MKKIVYLLGLPCTGKSTIVKEWGNRGGATLPEFLEPVPDFVHNSWRGDEDIKLKAQKWAVEQYIRKDELIRNLDCEGILIVERSPIDAVMYAKAFGGKVASWTELEVSKRLWSPGIPILLTTNLELLEERWTQGRGLSFEEWEYQWKPFSIALQKHYENLKRTFGIPSIQTDTSLVETMGRLQVVIENGLTYGVESLVSPSNYKERE